MMRRFETGSRLVIRAALALVFALPAGGCGAGKSEGLPANDVAREALDRALTMWRDGGSPGPVAGGSAKAEVHDTPWSLGDRLSSYEILSEDSTAAEMRFTVRLTLAKPERTQEVQYYTLGRDPIMIFRDEDYMRNINMVNGPPLTRPAKSGKKHGR